MNITYEKILGTLELHTWPPPPPPGGQHVGTGPSGVLLIHLESGIAVTRTESRSRYTNKMQAIEYLIALLTLAEPQWLK